MENGVGGIKMENIERIEKQTNEKIVYESSYTRKVGTIVAIVLTILLYLLLSIGVAYIVYEHKRNTVTSGKQEIVENLKNEMKQEKEMVPGKQEVEEEEVIKKKQIDSQGRTPLPSSIENDEDDEDYEEDFD